MKNMETHIDRSKSEDGMADGKLSETKEKIIMDTNQLVISLNTQVAVLTNSLNNNTKIIEEFIKKEDERHERMDTRVTMQRNDITRLETKLDNVVEDMREMKTKSNLLDLINFAITTGVGTIMYFLFGRNP